MLLKVLNCELYQSGSASLLAPLSLCEGTCEERNSNNGAQQGLDINSSGRMCTTREHYRSLTNSSVNGVAKPGELLAIMGASGAGKTCLLNVLASRNLNNMEVEGSVRVSDAESVLCHFLSDNVEQTTFR
ncbi:hypothetical protein ANCDUO_07928 [Ancylostoma duodenale]|uniref:ABC transporter domain-containing protein n=1 Tax=Ancylostoma duodenale TaxID=51022 RepID=A0A0C2GXD9_9BILA|nr:hypothetical protein ANCDUO_07928 [Ancylostoma duodenale]